MNISASGSVACDFEHGCSCFLKNDPQADVAWMQLNVRFLSLENYINFNWSRIRGVMLTSSAVGAQVAQWVRLVWVVRQSNHLSPIRRGFVPVFVNCKKECTRLAAASDKVYQLLAYGRWFSTGTLASSTTKTGRHDIAEILLKVAINIKNQINHH